MGGSRQLRSGSMLLALAGFGVAGCPLDERLLFEPIADGGAATADASPAGRTGSAGATGRLGSGGAADVTLGASGSGEPDSSVDAGGIAGQSGAQHGGAGNDSDGALGSGGTGDGHAGRGGCGDLDQNGVEDCVETLLKNSRFDENTSGWEPETYLHQNWDPRDGRGDGDSGALLVSNTNAIDSGAVGLTMVGSRQCLDVLRLRTYKIAAQLFIPSGQGDGHAGVNVFLYADPGCTGTFLHAYTPGFVSVADTWHVVTGEIETSPGTRSMLVRLVVSKPFALPEFEALFDNVLVRSE